MRSIDNKREMPWWTHTHPDMDAFFSEEDVRGAHVMWELIARPFKAIVLGNQNRLELLINQKWLRANPRPPDRPAPVISNDLVIAAPRKIMFYAPRLDSNHMMWDRSAILVDEIRYLIGKYGHAAVYEELNRCEISLYADR